MMSFRCLLLTAFAVVAMSPCPVVAQDDGEMVVRVYPVADIVRTVPDYPYQPGLPTTDPHRIGVRSTSTGAGGGGGGFGGGGQGGGGNGFFQIGGGGGGVMRVTPVRPSIDLNTLANVIQTSIAPSTWGLSGGDGTISELGTSLVIRQTNDVHMEVRELLEELSQVSDHQTMLTIRSFLLTLQPGEEANTWVARLRAAQEGQPVVGDVLAELERASDETAQITCFSGQRVHLASGQRRNVVTSLIPVVSAAVVGYQPVVSYPHIGSLHEFTTTINPDGESAMLDVRCSVTEWKDVGDPIRVFSQFGPGKAENMGSDTEGPGGPSGGEIDRVNITTRQLATTVRVPVSSAGTSPVPVIVGTLGQIAPTAENPDATNGLTYLIVTVSQNSLTGQR